jgi:hypothetical protein
MKYLLYIPALLILFSCKKTIESSNESSDEGMRSYSFNVNSKKYEEKGYCGGLYLCTFKTYTYNNKLDIDILTGSLLQPDILMITLPTKSKGTYHFDDKPLVMAWIPLYGSTGGGGYSNSYPGCYADITITSISNDLITGTFSGRLFKDGNVGSYVQITNGTFQACKE